MDKFIDKIIQGDCLKVMKKLPDKCIDLILTDPPYEIDWRASINFKNRKAMHHHITETVKWDKDVKNLYKLLFKEFDRVVKYTGSILIFTRTEYITYAVDHAKENNFDSKMTIIWKKTNPIPQIRKKNYLSAVEMVLWIARYSKEKCLYTFNFKTQNEMHNIIEIPICSGKERTEHPTQKPLTLLKRLLGVHSNENDIVLDPFLGSGSTAVACKMLDRHFIGIEINSKYYAMAKKRLDFKVQKRLFAENTFSQNKAIIEKQETLF